MRLQHTYETFQLVSLLRWPECSKNLSGDPNDLFCMAYAYIHFLRSTHQPAAGYKCILYTILQVLYLHMYIRIDVAFTVCVTGTPYRYCTAVLCVLFLSGKLSSEGEGYT